MPFNNSESFLEFIWPERANLSFEKNLFYQKETQFLRGKCRVARI